MKKYLQLTTVALLLSMNSFTQDVHFSHIHASPLLLNPAFAGMFDGDVRLIANARNQWRSVTANYTTVAASIDGRIANFGPGFFGSSLNVSADRAGDLDFTQSSASISMSYAINLDYKTTNFISFGVQGGMIGHSVDYTKLHVFDDEPYLNQTSSLTDMKAFDLNAGIAWWYRIDRNAMIYMGASMFHINEPDVAILGQAYGASEHLFKRRNFHLGAEYKAHSQLTVMPSILYMDQGPHKEYLAGGFLKYRPSLLKTAFYDHAYFGAWFRWYSERDGYKGTDAAVLTARIDRGPLTLAMSYDINLSTLTRASYGRGGPELSIIVTIDKPRKVKSGGSSKKSGGGTCPSSQRVKRGAMDCPKF